MECWFNEAIELRKGDIVKIIRAFPNTNPLRVSKIQNLTTGLERTSHDEGIQMTISPVDFDLAGKVVSSKIAGNNVTEFVIEEGIITPDHVFVRAGEKQKGRDALIEILKNQLDTYVKICDPYISPDTIKLFTNVPKGIDILILTQNIDNLQQVKQEILKLKNKVSIKKVSGLHDRFILTKVEGWAVGHSLKDFGTKDSYLSKMIPSADAEFTFDQRWTQAVSC